MSGRIVIVPFARTNPDGKADGSWRLMYEENGKRKHINHADNLDSAIKKAEKAAAKRGATFEAPDTPPRDATPEEEDPETDTQPRKDRKDYMNVRNSGAPDIGARVVETLIDDTELQGIVTEHLASQFVYETDNGKQRIVLNNGDWKYSAA